MGVALAINFANEKAIILTLHLIVLVVFKVAFLRKEPLSPGIEIVVALAMAIAVAVAVAVGSALWVDT